MKQFSMSILTHTCWLCYVYTQPPILHLFTFHTFRGSQLQFCPSSHNTNVKQSVLQWLIKIFKYRRKGKATFLGPKHSGRNRSIGDYHYVKLIRKLVEHPLLSNRCCFLQMPSKVNLRTESFILHLQLSNEIHSTDV